MADGVFTVRIPAELQAQLDAVAVAMERPRNWIVNKAIEEFVALNAWQVGEIRQAIAEADAEDFATDEEVEATFKRLCGSGG